MAKILVIDDVRVNREVITAVLSPFGHRLMEAWDGKEGLKLTRAERPDLVIVDLLMPTMSGYEFVSRLRQEASIAATPVIFYSATFLEGETKLLAKACNVSHVLAKPSDPEEILRVVNETLKEGPAKVPPLIGHARPAVDVVQVLNNKLFEKNRELLDLNARLEHMVSQRTAELEQANHQLREQIAERERAEQQLRQIQKLEDIGRLAGGVAHDFNNLLGVILGRCEILLSRHSSNEPVYEGLRIIEESAERGAKLTQQLLAFGRRQVLEPKVLDFNGIVENLETLLQRLIGEDIELEFRLGSALGNVRADPSQIEQVIMNLAVNARESMPKGGKLTIATANAELDQSYAEGRSVMKPGSYVMLAVTDSGCGMDPATQSHIFEPFFTTKEKGTGLGLATVYGIIKQSGGYIWVYSEPGHGTTFKIYLPLAAGEAQKQVPRIRTSMVLRGSETVLVVEDDDGLRELTHEFLHCSGYKVLEAVAPKEALEAARNYNGRIDLLLTDVIMPGMNGRELAAELLSSRPEMKVLYISGYTDDAIMRHGVLEQGLWFLQKPFSRYALTQKVREVLGEPSSLEGKTIAHRHASPSGD